MDDAALHASSVELFTHVRIIIGMVMGISISKLIVGLTRFIQHPKRDHIYLPHLGWVFFVLLFIIHFWWFEFALSRRHDWSFGVYFFLITYAGLFAALSALLFPDAMNEYDGFKDYFTRRKNAFYTILVIVFVADSLDTFLKGAEYYRTYYGWDYPIRQGLLIAGTLLAMIWRSERYQAAFVLFALTFQIVWVVTLFEVLR